MKYCLLLLAFFATSIQAQTVGEPTSEWLEEGNKIATFRHHQRQFNWLLAPFCRPIGMVGDPPALVQDPDSDFIDPSPFNVPQTLGLPPGTVLTDVNDQALASTELNKFLIQKWTPVLTEAANRRSSVQLTFQLPTGSSLTKKVFPHLVCMQRPWLYSHPFLVTDSNYDSQRKVDELASKQEGYLAIFEYAKLSAFGFLADQSTGMKIDAFGRVLSVLGSNPNLIPSPSSRARYDRSSSDYSWNTAALESYFMFTDNDHLRADFLSMVALKKMGLSTKAYVSWVLARGIQLPVDKGQTSRNYNDSAKSKLLKMQELIDSGNAVAASAEVDLRLTPRQQKFLEDNTIPFRKTPAKSQPRAATTSAVPATSSSAVLSKAVAEPASPLRLANPPTQFAKLDDTSIGPVSQEKCRKAYQEWLKRPQPRAFVIDSANADRCTGANGTRPSEPSLPTDPLERALHYCKVREGAVCKFYAIDDDVVWQSGPVEALAAAKPVETTKAVYVPSAKSNEIRLANPPTSFAAIDDLTATPIASERCKKTYQDWLKRSPPRAFVIDSTTADRCWGSSGTKPPDPNMPPDPVERALLYCTTRSGTNCKVYAIDNSVVWQIPTGSTP